MKKQTCQLNNLQDLDELAEKIVKNIKKYPLITFSGDLGSGKTSLIQLIGKRLGVKSRITSPSFVLVKIYKLPKTIYNIKTICHADFYRAETGSFTAINEYINAPNVLTLIEWPEQLKKIPRPRLNITIKINKDNSRTITLVQLPATEKK